MKESLGGRWGYLTAPPETSREGTVKRFRIDWRELPWCVFTGLGYGVATTIAFASMMWMFLTVVVKISPEPYLQYLAFMFIGAFVGLSISFALADYVRSADFFGESDRETPAGLFQSPGQVGQSLPQ